MELCYKYNLTNMPLVAPGCQLTIRKDIGWEIYNGLSINSKMIEKAGHRVTVRNISLLLNAPVNTKIKNITSIYIGDHFVWTIDMFEERNNLVGIVCLGKILLF